ncbi:class I SAM-dependent methyltransferase [Sulfobacillus thermosulfidooxidans]|uniref:class I SAM-dependent methyltransferase n=1 Tax=Sulfobacillus thermosulfidooxidans TaxID=28034 RepID=UPI00096BA5B8|nr:class I SAM-dependent methyltransferase [Sulfobacillus thermosulfidooxidans]OLZ08494.1 hypothetical protein BFX05_02890 [Sulfobacillus thermosulfidooxidans]OLZ13097.1 hypothetical protein BFX06_11140 [Sulfobacillus thermosulfidooxidans]OLZ21477.1 hypothetical protein BFX07_11565 [Sulfobacillus thermosulfidooxidans]
MPHHSHDFDPVRLVQMETSRRDIFPPHMTLDHFLVRPDMVIADIGCGPGYYAIEAAQRLPEGQVYAIDRQQDMLEWTKKRAQNSGLTNLMGLKASADQIPLEAESLDAVLMANVLHDLPDHARVVTEVYRLLKPGGTYFLVEWDKIPTEFGPPLEIRFTPSELMNLLNHHHFEHIQQIEAPAPWFQIRAKKPTH